MFSRAKSIFYCYISFFLFAIYVLFVRSILFPNNKLHQGLLQKRKIDPIELYAWLLSNRLFQYKIQRALTHFSISRWLLKHQMIFWMKKKCPSLQLYVVYVPIPQRLILCQKSEMIVIGYVDMDIFAYFEAGKE